MRKARCSAASSDVCCARDVHAVVVFNRGSFSPAIGRAACLV
jgi:hypothetical protein